MRFDTVRALALVVAMTLVPASVALTAEPTRPQAEPPAPMPQADTAAPGGLKDSIHVRGHWVIEVRNPDGSLVTRREFTNALAGGATSISRYLARLDTPGLWNIRLSGAPSPCVGTGLPGDCFITESRSGRPAAANISKSLTLAANPLTLSGNITVPAAGSITAVGTGSDFCAPGITPTACLGNFNNQPIIPGAQSPFPSNFTATAITPVAVTGGQQVAVTVTITFSTTP